MLKLGICEVNHDTYGQRLWRRGLRAANLLAMPSAPGDADIRRFESVMRDICLSNRVARTTERNRFNQLDRQVISALAKVYSATACLAVEDWAVSSGLTALEWYETLRNYYRDVWFTASDHILFLFEVRSQSKGTYIVEPDGTPIQYISPPFVVSLVEAPHFAFPVNRFLQRSAMRAWKNSWAEKFQPPTEWSSLDLQQHWISIPPFTMRQLPLIHPEVSRLRNERFRLRKHSVFSPLPIPVDVIRTMNILNLAYFSEPQLQVAIRSVYQSLRIGGIWIVGRTLDKEAFCQEVTVFRKTLEGWEVLFRVGGGSEIEQIVNRSA